MSFFSSNYVSSCLICFISKEKMCPPGPLLKFSERKETRNASFGGFFFFFALYLVLDFMVL